MTTHRPRRALRLLPALGLLGVAVVAVGGTVASDVLIAQPGRGGALVVTGSSSNNGDSGNVVCKGSPKNQVCTDRLEVALGTSALMYPTVPVSVPVTVSNNRNQSVRLVQITIDRLGDATNTSCRAVNVDYRTVRDLSGTTVPASGRRAIWTPALTMRPDAPATCQRATFPLTVTVTGVRD